MTMNTRQAGAFTELINKENQSRARWEATHGAAYAAQVAARTARGQQTARPSTASFGGGNSRPISARPSSAGPSGRTTGAGYANGVSQPGAGATASGRPHEVFQNALAVGTPRLVDQNDRDFTKPQTVTKKVVRQVEVPTTREVKVPIKTQKIVTDMVPQQVRSKKLVEYDAMTERDEEYDEVQTIASTRQREVLVKQLVTEPYNREVTVKRTRKVQVPTKKFKEVDEWHTVQIPQQRTIEVDGVRVDRVNETKLVDVTEYHTYELQPVPTGEAQVISTKDVGTGRRLSGRVTGRNLYHAADPAVAHLDHDNSLSSTRVRPASAGPAGRNAPRGTGAPVGSLSQRFMPQSGVSSDSRRLGFKVRSSSMLPGTLSVFEVEPGQLASRSGLKPGDAVLSANGRACRALADFKAAVADSRGPLLLQVKRGADRFVVTIPR